MDILQNSGEFREIHDLIFQLPWSIVKAYKYNTIIKLSTQKHKQLLLKIIQLYLKCNCFKFISWVVLDTLCFVISKTRLDAGRMPRTTKRAESLIFTDIWGNKIVDE